MALAAAVAALAAVDAPVARCRCQRASLELVPRRCGFYQLITKVDTVYLINLPAGAQCAKNWWRCCVRVVVATCAAPLCISRVCHRREANARHLQRRRLLWPRLHRFCAHVPRPRRLSLPAPLLDLHAHRPHLLGRRRHARTPHAQAQALLHGARGWGAARDHAPHLPSLPDHCEQSLRGAQAELKEKFHAAMSRWIRITEPIDAHLSRRPSRTTRSKI